MKAGIEESVSFGAGAKFHFYIHYQKGKFVARANAKLVWGAGGGGGFAFTVNADTIVDFCAFVYHQLKNKDFHFVDVLSEDSFKYYDTISSYIAMTDKALDEVYREGRDFMFTMQETIEDKLAAMKATIEQHEQSSELAEKILGRPHNFVFLTPEGKGRLIFHLCPCVWYSAEEKQEEAIMAILRTIQTWNEYIEVMAHCTETGIHGSFRTGEDLVQNVLDGSDKWQFNRLRQQLRHCYKLPRQAQMHMAAVRDNRSTNMA